MVYYLTVKQLEEIKPSLKLSDVVIITKDPPSIPLSATERIRAYEYSKQTGRPRKPFSKRFIEAYESYAQGDISAREAAHKLVLPLSSFYSMVYKYERMKYYGA